MHGICSALGQAVNSQISYSNIEVIKSISHTHSSSLFRLQLVLCNQNAATYLMLSLTPLGFHHKNVTAWVTNQMYYQIMLTKIRKIGLKNWFHRNMNIWLATNSNKYCTFLPSQIRNSKWRTVQKEFAFYLKNVDFILIWLVKHKYRQ